MKKLIGLLILLMTVLTENSFAAVDQWKQLDVPGSQERLLINEIKKSELFAGQMLTTITLLIDLSAISDYRFIVCALNAYEDKDSVIELKFKSDHLSPHELRLELAVIFDGLSEIFRSLSETKEFLIEEEYLVLREIVEDGFYLSGEEDLSEEAAIAFLEDDSNGEVPW